MWDPQTKAIVAGKQVKLKLWAWQKIGPLASKYQSVPRLMGALTIRAIQRNPSKKKSLLKFNMETVKVKNISVRKNLGTLLTRFLRTPQTTSLSLSRALPMRAPRRPTRTSPKIPTPASVPAHKQPRTPLSTRRMRRCTTVRPRATRVSAQHSRAQHDPMDVNLFSQRLRSTK